MSYYDWWSYDESARWQIIKDTALIKRVREQYPKRRRRQPALCPVTGLETDAPDGLSREAWKWIEKGLKYDQDQERFADKEYWYAGYGWGRDNVNAIHGPEGERYQDPLEEPDVTHWHNGPPTIRHRRYSDFSLIELIAAVTEQPVKRIENLYGDKSLTDFKRLELEPKNASTLLGVKLSLAQALVVRRAGHMLAWWVDQVMREQYKRGESVWIRMATGNITIDEINQLSTGDKPK